MSTKIEWCDETWNPITGCGQDFDCWKYCYARKLAEGRLRGRCGYPADNPFKPGTEHPEQWDKPLHWRKPRRIFVCSMGDQFHDAVPFGLVDKVIAIAALCPQHTFMLLTKRPKRMHEYFKGIQSGSNETVSRLLKHPNYQRALHAPVLKYREGVPLPNLWLGVTAENQAAADERIPILLQIPATIRFVSIEPMLGGVDLDSIEQTVAPGYFGSVLHWWHQPHCERHVPYPTLDWVICGGETGPRARPMHPDWARGLRDQCIQADVPFFFKQWGEWAPPFSGCLLVGSRWDTKVAGDAPRSGFVKSRYRGSNPNLGTVVYRVGKKAAGRELDGRTWDQVPGEVA